MSPTGGGRRTDAEATATRRCGSTRSRARATGRALSLRWRAISTSIFRGGACLMSESQACPRVPVSWGELLDKITILQIKHERIGDAQARANVARELELLGEVAAEQLGRAALAEPIARLRAVNQELWEIEDSIRECEAAGDFGARFVQLARSVYQKNDRRAAIKREINAASGSALVEEKSY